MTLKPPFRSSKWLVVLLVFGVLILGALWVALRHADNARKAIDAVITRQLAEGMRVLQTHATNGHYPDLTTARDIANRPDFQKVIKETTLLSTQDWFYNPSQPASESMPNIALLGARFGNRLLILQLDGSVRELSGGQINQSGLVPLFAP
jgi:Tfp pilus assembly protein PilV